MKWVLALSSKMDIGAPNTKDAHSIKITRVDVDVSDQ